MTSTQAKWTKIIETALASGMSNGDFVKANGLNSRTFSWWKWQVTAFKRTGAWPTNNSIENSSLASVQPTTTCASEPVVGSAHAAKILGIKQKSLQNAMYRHRVTNDPPTKDNVNAMFSPWTWRDESHLRSWWSGLTNRPISKENCEPSKENRAIRKGKSINNEEQMISSLLGEGILDNLRGYQKQLDTPEVRMLRSARGEVPIMPLSEILQMVVGFGIANWPLDLKE